MENFILLDGPWEGRGGIGVFLLRVDEVRVGKGKGRISIAWTRMES